MGDWGWDSREALFGPSVVAQEVLLVARSKWPTSQARSMRETSLALEASTAQEATRPPGFRGQPDLPFRLVLPGSGVAALQLPVKAYGRDAGRSLQTLKH